MVKKVVRKQRGGGFKPLRIGGTKKNPRQAKPGYDQEFTLPKGGSAAPIKQVDTSKYTRAKTTSGDKVFGNKKSVWSGLKKKDADVILKPLRKARNKKIRNRTLLGLGVAAGVRATDTDVRLARAINRRAAKKGRKGRSYSFQRDLSRQKQRGLISASGRKKRP